CDATEIVFTSGGSEANNQALKGIFFAKQSEVPTPHFIISQIEHPAIREPCRFLQSLGAELTCLPVDSQGLVDPAEVRHAIRKNTVLISIMHANNEVGTIQPIEEIAAIAREYEVLCHTDAAQSAGKIPVDVDTMNVDLLSVAGHKLYGPKGVGALFMREGIDLESLVHGAEHEAGRRAGTENILEIVGLGAACALAQQTLENTQTRELCDDFWQKLKSAFGEDVVLNGHPERRLPNTLNVSFPGRDGGDILARLPWLAASTGSACHAGSVEISPVLAAMGVSQEIGLGTVRFSLGRTTTRSEIDQVLQGLIQIIGKSTEQKM
ncbi:MAG: cysteine desulfurase family protein, partial [Planctomycetota bacterium]